MIVGIDPSSRKLAIFILGDGAAPKVIEVPSKMKDRAQICEYMLDRTSSFFSSLSTSSEPVYLWIEDPVMGRAGAHATIVQAQVHGVVLASAIHSGLSAAYSVNNKVWKKDTVANGNASKDAVGEWLRASFPSLFSLCGGDQDLIDACCIAIYGQQVLARADQLTR